MLVKGKQIATGDDGIVNANIKDSTILPAKVDLTADGWDFTTNAPTYNADPVAANDLCRKSYVDGVAAGLDWKESVVCATTTSLTLASDVEDGDTIDGVTLATGDRVLIKDQGSAENGLYTVNASGAPTRTSDLPAASSAASMAVFIEEGTTNADTGWVCTNDVGSDVVGTDTLAYTQFTGTSTDTNAIHVNQSGEISGITEKTTPVAADLLVIEDSAASNAKKRLTVGNLRSFVVASATTGSPLADTASAGSASDAAKADHVHPRDDVVQEPITTENITGTDTALGDTLASTPIANAEVQLWLNGILQVQGAGNDYTLSSTTITWLASSGTAVDMENDDVLIARYKTQGS